MSKSLVIQSGGQTLGSAQTKYIMPTTGRLDTGSYTNLRRTIHTAGVFSGLGVRILTNTLNVTTTLKSYLNGANGNLAISILTTQTGWFQDASNSDSVSASDYYCFEFVCPTATGGLTYSLVKCTFEATTNTVALYGGVFLNTANVDRPLGISGNGTSNAAAETDVQCKINVPGTFQNFGVNVASNNFTVGPVLRSRVNGANGNCAIAITAGTTGRYEDLSNTDVVTAGDLYNMMIDVAEAKTILGYFYLELLNTTDGKSDIFFNVPLGLTTASAAYAALSGVNTNATEANIYADTVDWSGVASNLRCFVSGASGSPTVNLRVGGANYHQSAAISGASGWFEDTTHTDNINPANDYNYFLNIGGGGSIKVFSIAMTLTPAGPPTQISKIAGVAQASISKVGTVAIANVAAVAGVPNV